MERTGRTAVILCIITMRMFHLAIPCSKLVFHGFRGKRAEGNIGVDVANTSVDQCLRACRLTNGCNRFNFAVTDGENDRCQVVTEQTRVTNSSEWASYVTCPEGMEYYQSTGLCYRLSPKTLNFDNARKYCSSLSPGVHLVDIENDAEAEVCHGYRVQTGKPIFAAARRPDGSNKSDEFYWITTGERLHYTDWLPHKPTEHTDRECLTIDEMNGVTGWLNMPCSFNFYALCEF